MSTATHPTSKHPRNRQTASVWLEFLGSMNLAITLLVAIAVASVVGTVLQQNQAYQDYIIKFGPFWFDVFDRLGLFNVYGAGWFMLILTFLVVSTSVCIYRNTPNMLREMRSYRTRVQRKSLEAFHQRREWQVAASGIDIQKALGGWLSNHGYRFRVKSGDDHILLAAMRGRLNRLGYFCTHTAIVVICLGALFDGNFPLVLREAAGKLKPETRDLPASEVPAISRLPVDNPSFRGSVRVPEGTSANVLFLQMRDGYLVQPLPFSVEVKDFRIEHYTTGQPKSYESDLVIRDPAEAEPIEQTISVNHPWIYKGYAIYQASFSDGGTGLSLSAWPVNSAAAEPHVLKGVVFEDLKVETARGPMTLEFTDFRMFNINPVIDADGNEEQKNFGPSFTYKLRDAQGQALEYENYMSPVEFDGRMYYLSGVRESAAEPFRYLHIPVDANGGPQRFIKYNALLYDDERVLAVVRQTTDQSFGQVEMDKPVLQEDVVQSMLRLVARYRQGGFDAVAAMVESNVPADKREEVLEAYFNVLQTLLGELYLELLANEGVDIEQDFGAEEGLFLDEALAAIGSLGSYASPFYLQLTAFDFVQASGLQIARTPGKNVVYFGFALLIAGVFLMFYVPNRRLWCWIDQQDGTGRVLLAGTGNRHQRDFKEEFEHLCGQLDARWKTS
ncbi:cytochrome c biogenesis protein ResB [Pseudomonadota bacterium]